MTATRSIGVPLVALLGALVMSSVLTGPPSASTRELPTMRQRGVVAKIVDGDTLDVRLGSGRTRRVRMLGIDTPEVYGTVECGGPQASRSLRRLLPLGARVRLVSDSTQDRTDRYGRLLRYVVRSSTDVDVNRAQVARGWATVYVYNDNPFRRVREYRRAQRRAAANDRGIWGVC